MLVVPGEPRPHGVWPAAQTRPEDAFEPLGGRRRQVKLDPRDLR
jgi:hypothetical protein